jgi:hypothetical protein
MSRIRTELVNQSFGWLKVISVTDERQNSHTIYLVNCTRCGQDAKIVGSYLTRKVRPFRYCGCRTINQTHKHCSNGKRSGIYSSYWAMRNRVGNVNQGNHKYYSDVKICKRWLGVGGFERFAKDMGGFRPEGTTLSRLKDGRLYCKSRCRWHTVTQQREQQRLKRAAK